VKPRKAWVPAPQARTASEGTATLSTKAAD